MSILSSLSCLCRAAAPRTSSPCRRPAFRRVLCVERLESRMLLSATSVTPVVEPLPVSSTPAVEATVETLLADKPASGANAKGVVKALAAKLNAVDHNPFLKLEVDADDVLKAEAAADDPQASHLVEKGQHIVQSLQEKAGKQTGGGRRAIKFEEMVSIFTEISRTLEQNPSAANNAADFVSILGGILSNTTGIPLSIQLVNAQGVSLTATSAEVVPGGTVGDAASAPSDSSGSTSDPALAPSDSSGSTSDPALAPSDSSGSTEPNSGSEPYLLSFDASAGLYDTWILEGTATYVEPWALSVVFRGVVSGSTSVAADGSFSYSTILPPDTNGIVTAQAYDPAGVGSNVVYDYITGSSSSSS